MLVVLILFPAVPAPSLVPVPSTLTSNIALPYTFFSIPADVHTYVPKRLNPQICADNF